METTFGNGSYGGSYAATRTNEKLAELVAFKILNLALNNCGGFGEFQECSFPKEQNQNLSETFEKYWNKFWWINTCYLQLHVHTTPFECIEIAHRFSLTFYFQGLVKNSATGMNRVCFSSNQASRKSPFANDFWSKSNHLKNRNFAPQ